MNHSTRYRIGIIGVGEIAEFRTIPAIIATNLFDLVCIYDSNPDRMDYISKKFSIPKAITIEEFYAKSCDAVYIATPNCYHVPLAIQAMEHGAAILLEKPCADTLEAAKELLQASVQFKKPVLMGYMHRFNRHNQVAKKLVTENVIGDICSFTASFGFYNTNLNGWRFLRDKSGPGALADLGIYAISTALNIFGEMPVSCSAQAYPAGNSLWGDRYLNGRLHFSGGRWMQMETSFLSNSCGYTIVGTEGVMHVEGSWAQTGEGEIVLCNGDKVKKFTEEIVDPYEEEIKALKKCIDGEPVPEIISVKRAVDDVNVMCALDRSAACGGKEILIG